MTADTPSSVLLAGGGTAGHVSPLLALADCLRRRDPDIVVTALGTETGLESRLVPERGYPLLTVPKVPLPRKPSGDLLRLPGNLRAAVAAAERAIERVRRPGRRRLRRLRLHPCLPRRAAPPHPHRRARAERPAGSGQPARRADDPVRRDDLRAAPSWPTPPPSACRCAARSPSSTASASRAEALAHFGLDPHWPTAPRHRRVARAPSGSTPPSRPGSPRCARPGCRCCTSPAPARSSMPATGGPGAPYVVAPYADRMDLAYAAADLVVARAGANTVCELTAVGLPAVYVPLPDRQRRAAVQRRRRRRRRWRAARRRRGPHPGAGSTPRSCPSCPTATASTPWRRPRPRRGSAAPTSCSPTWWSRPSPSPLRGQR